MRAVIAEMRIQPRFGANNGAVHRKQAEASRYGQ
jgi:hypothetical protein